MDIQELQQYLNQKFQGKDSFLDTILYPIFGEENFTNAWDIDVLDDDDLIGLAQRTGIKSAIKYGTFDLPHNTIDIFEITVSSRVQMQRNRVNIQQLVRRIMDTYSSAFIIFHYDSSDVWDWRFSFCQKDDKNLTEAKRYTFLLGPGQSCRTAADNFNKLFALHGNVKREDIVKAFDVEALSKEFFEKYKVHYGNFVGYVLGKEYVDKGEGKGEWVDKAGSQPSELYYSLNQDEKIIRDYVKKLLGRIVFLHFLQKKGWMGVPADKKWGEGDTDFMLHLYQRATEEQKNNYLDEILEPLFSKALDTDRTVNSDLYDTKVEGFRNVKIPYLNGGLFERDYLDEPDSRFPAELFNRLFEFFYQYNFTIDENDPNDAQVGVDPEMLGRIFENLLEDNKDKGAFYTPKEIVQYMCKESLIAYLQTNVTDEPTREALRQFVMTYDASVINGKDSRLAQQVDCILKDVKICDPAIGSGAFPMGLLKELFFCRGAIEAFDNAAEIKRHIIQQNIYGVDIERGAVDIARLRFWLALIVDEKTPHALPNMDFKIMQGNSLLEQYNGVDLSNIYSPIQKQLEIAFDEESMAKALFQEHIYKYFRTGNHEERKHLLDEINNTVKKLVRAKSLNNREISANIDNIDFKNNTDFFLWHTWFSDVFKQGGFDIVIGNPPYISYYSNTGQTLTDEQRKTYLNTFETVKKLDDRINLMNLMLEKGINLLNKNGHLAFITNKTTSVLPSYLSTRKYVIEKCDFEYYVPNLSPFKAIVDCVILGITKHKSNGNFKLWSSDLKGSEIKNINAFKGNRLLEFTISKDAEILAKIDKADNRFKDALVINRGVNIGGCFEEFLSNSRVTNEYRKYLSGTANINRFSYSWQAKDGYMKLDTNLEKELKANGKTLALGDPGRYNKQRLIIPESSQVIIAAYCDEEIYTAYGLMIATLRNEKYNLKYLCALLNSNLITFYAIEKEILRKGNKSTPHVGTKGLLDLPLPNVNIQQQNYLANLADELEEAKRTRKSNLDYLYRQLNKCVYEYYHVTNFADEIENYISEKKLVIY